MRNEIADFRLHVSTLFRDTDFQREAAQLQAKALLTEVSTQVPLYRWNYVAQRVIRNIVQATFELETISLEDTSLIGNLSDEARKFALIWESLAQLKEGTSRETALLNAAVDYDLAGYQANAISIAKLLTRDELRIEQPSLAELTGLFLRRRFLQLTTLLKVVQAQPSLENSRAQIIDLMGLALTAKAFSLALRFFLTGDDQALQRGNSAFERAEKLYSSLNFVSESNAIRGIRSLVPLMAARSTWRLLGGITPDQHKWRRYLKLLARGGGPDILKARSISELWPSQISALQRGLLTSDSNKVVRMPTSAGKTRIAELAIVHTLINIPESKCVYVAPFRALVSEIEQSFFGLLSDLGYRVSSVTGSFEADDFEEYLFRITDVLVVTPEKLDLVLRAHPEFLGRVRLFVLDEGHIVHDAGRGIKFEILLTRLKRKLPNARFIILSAVIPQETLEDFAQWFNASPIQDILTSTWRPSIQRYARFEWVGPVGAMQTGVIRYAPERDIPSLSEYVPGVIIQQTYEYINPETGKRKRPVFPTSSSKVQIAAELAFKFAELGPVLVFCAQANHVESVAKALMQKLELLRLTGQGLPAYFQGHDRTRSALLAEDWLGERDISSWLRTGIAVHHGDLPDVLRNAIETDFRQRNYRVLVATNTLGQGVNLPIRTVIVHSCWRYVNDRMRRILARDYWNIAGRAGRAGEETEGLIIHIALNENDRTDFQYYSDHKDNVEPVEGALYQRLLDLTQHRLTDEALKTEIDPEVLGILAEESTESLLDIPGPNILDDSLVKVQAERHQQQAGLERIKHVFATAASSIRERVQDPELRKVFSATGLTSTSCLSITEDISLRGTQVREIFLGGNEKRAEMIELLLPICLNLNEMQPEREFSGNYNELLTRWIEGAEIKDIMAEFGSEASSLEELGDFIDDLFGYRLPWGISAYVRILSQQLRIDHQDLSDLSRALPMMVKFGLPNPIACWAMSAGVPFRRTAISIASAYLSESHLVTHDDFLQWLGALNTDDLHYGFGLTSPILEDVSRAIFSAAPNPFLRTSVDPTGLLPQETEIRGIKYENRAVVALSARVGQAVDLARDYDNAMDRNAIQVFLSGSELGFLPRWVAQVLAPEIDTGAGYGAVITRLSTDNPPRVSIRIQRIGD